jgi:hypothetical protein
VTVSENVLGIWWNVKTADAETKVSAQLTYSWHERIDAMPAQRLRIWTYPETGKVSDP